MLNIVNPLILLVVVASHGLAQPQGPEATVGALYEVISGPAGQKRDWDKFRSLFVEDAKMRVVVKRQGGPHELRTLTLDDYVNRSGPMLEQRGFFEKQIAAKVERYDGLVQIFSTYEARSKADDEKPMDRGINSIQLVQIGETWKIVSIVWQAESSGVPVPATYLPKAGG